MCTNIDSPSELGQLGVLPAELRYQIYRHTFPSASIQSLRSVGFGFPPRACNVFITLPAGHLMNLYLQNPAGYGIGSFWKGPKMALLSRAIREEVESEWAICTLVHVGTWLSFLKERPQHALTGISYCQFRYWLRDRWDPDPIAPQFQNMALQHWIDEFSQEWATSVEEFARIVGPKTLSKTVLDFSLVNPPILTYRVRPGFNVDLKALLARIKDTMTAKLEHFEIQGAWPASEVVLLDVST